MNAHEMDIRRESKAEGRMEGAQQKAIETARNLFAIQLSADQISVATSLPLETVLQLQAELQPLSTK